MDGVHLSPASELCLDGNLAENWRKWKRNFENYLIAINLVAQPKDTDGNWPNGNTAVWKRQIAILRHCIGKEAVEILNQFEFDEDADPGEDGSHTPDVLVKFDSYFNPRRNLFYKWYVFMSMNQGDGEPIDMFVKRLKTQANKCEFKGKREMMILVRCVFGIKDQRLKEKLLQDKTVGLNGAINLIRASKFTKSQLAEISGERSVSIVKSEGRPSPRQIPVSAPRKVTDCRFCGFDYMKEKCPAFGKDCRACGGKNHFRSKCTKKEVNLISFDSAMKMNDLFIGIISQKEDSPQGWFKSYDVYGGQNCKNIRFKVDTGAEANVLPLSQTKDLCGDVLPSEARLRSYSGDILGHTLGLDKDGVMTLDFELVDANVVPILGLDACVGLGIVKRIDILNNQAILDEFADCFEGIGCFDREHTIRVDPNVKPVINRARHIPLSRVENVKAELDKMEANGIIVKVDQPTEWVNNMVVVEKRDGSVRICLDPKELNKAVMREHHHIPTLEDISYKFSGMTVFTIVDMKSGYWHIQLDRPSQLLTTFNTPFGRYCYKWLPFGINFSAEDFEKRVKEVFGDLDVSIYFDDLIIAGKDQEGHDCKLKKVLQRARKRNVRFNKEKIQHNRFEVSYLGHMVLKEGLSH